MRLRRSMVAVLLMAAILCCATPAYAQLPGRAGPASGTKPHPAARADVARFRARVEASLADAHAQKALWGVFVVDRDTGETLYELNADRFFTPASDAKAFTSALALATLGPDYRFHTTLEAKGAIGEDGRLAGDLIFVGRGDPDLSNRKFPYAGKVERDGPVEKILAELADAAVAKGLKEVDGDIVADDSYFPFDPYPAGWSIGDLYFTFGAPVSAIAFNENSISIQVQPGARAGVSGSIVVEPGLALDSFGHEITTGPPDAKPDLAVVRQPGSNFLLLRGLIPVGHEPIKLDLAMSEPAEIAARVLKQLLEARGVRVRGTVRVRHAPPPDTSDAGDLPPASASAQPDAPNSVILAEHVSLPLLESIRLMNKISQNLHAELLLRTVAREKTGIGSTVSGLKVEQEFVKTAGIADGEVVFADGSGLSRDNLVTPRAVVGLLRYALEQPWGADYISTFPIAGVDGTLESRMKGTSASGLIQAKTGGLERVRAMSGYARTQCGERLVFVIIGNNNPEHGHDAIVALDEIGVAMVETLGAPPPKRKKK